MALLLTACIVFITTCCLCASAPDYAVQPRPIIFTEEPQSLTVPEGNNVTLHCNFKVNRLGSNYPLPYIVWRKNGTEVLQTVRDTYSELLLQSVQLEDEGYYECLAVDGMRKKKLDPAGVGKYVMSSRRAYLTVTVPDTMEIESHVKTLVALSGEPLLVPCQASTIYSSTAVQWYQNGTVLNRDDIEILSNGSLLLLSPHVGHSGSYECINWFENQIVHQQYTDMTILQDAYSGPPRVFLDSPSTVLIAGDTLNITCYVGGVTGNTSTLRLLREGVVIRETTLDYTKHKFSVTNLSSASFGHYMCEVLLDGHFSHLSPTFRFTEESSVTLSQDKAIFSESVSLTCDDGGSVFSSIYWYKNGQELVEFANSTHLEMSAEHMDNLTGVYQCFGQRSGGVSSITTRVFNFLFSNPPTNLKCEVKFNPYNYPWPLVTMNWGHPDYVAAGEVEEYIVTATDGLNIRKVVWSTSAEVDLSGIDDYETSEGLYELFVAANKPMNHGSPTSAPTRCTVNTIDRALDPPLPLHASCPDTVGMAIQFTWTNPLHESNFNVPIWYINISARCIYGSEPLHSVYVDYDYYDYVDTAESSYRITLDTIPSGAVCISAGTYQLDDASLNNDEEIIIPQKACSTPSSQRGESSVLLGLLCSQGVVEMTWNTSLHSFSSTDSITLHIKCATMEWSEEVFIHKQARFAGHEVVNNISSDAMCTFYGWYTDTRTGNREEIPPAQCYMGQPSDRAFYPPVIVPNITIYSTYKTLSTYKPSSTYIPVPSLILLPSTTFANISTVHPEPQASQTLDSDTKTTKCFNQSQAALWFLLALTLVTFCTLIMLVVVMIIFLRKLRTYNMPTNSINLEKEKPI